MFELATPIDTSSILFNKFDLSDEFIKVGIWYVNTRIQVVFFDTRGCVAIFLGALERCCKVW